MYVLSVTRLYNIFIYIYIGKRWQNGHFCCKCKKNYADAVWHHDNSINNIKNRVTVSVQRQQTNIVLKYQSMQQLMSTYWNLSALVTRRKKNAIIRHHVRPTWTTNHIHQSVSLSFRKGSQCSDTVVWATGRSPELQKSRVSIPATPKGSPNPILMIFHGHARSLQIGLFARSHTAS